MSSKKTPNQRRELTRSFWAKTALDLVSDSKSGVETRLEVTDENLNLIQPGGSTCIPMKNELEQENRTSSMTLVSLESPGKG